MINICSPCWWTDMWRWSWGIQIFPNIGGHIAPGISDWTFWGSPLPIEHLPPLRSFIFFLHHSPILFMKLTTVNEYVWLFSSEVGFIDDGSSLLVVGFAFAFVRFAYFELIIWVLSGLVCNLHIDDQTLTKMSSRKTKHFYLPTLALGSADWEHTKRPPPPLSSSGVPTPSTATNYKDLPIQQYLNFMFEDICTNYRDPVNICTIFFKQSYLSSGI